MSKEKDFQEKTEELGKNLQSWGCALTIFLTIPIILFVFLGPIGLIISGAIIVLYLFGRNKNNNNTKNKNQNSQKDVKFVRDNSEVEEGDIYRFYDDDFNVIRFKRKTPEGFTRWNERGKSQKVVGTSHRQEVCKKFINAKKRKVDVEYAPTEEHPSAIVVKGIWQDDEKIHNEKIGYIESDISQEIHNTYDNLPIKANLATIYKPTNDKNLGIRVFLLRKKRPSKYKK